MFPTETEALLIGWIDSENQSLRSSIRYRDARASFLGEGREWWRRDENDALVMEWDKSGFIQIEFRLLISRITWHNVP